MSFDSWITATLTLCRSKKSHSSTCLLPMPFALNCRMVKGSPSEALVVVGMEAVSVFVEWVVNCKRCMPSS